MTQDEIRAIAPKNEELALTILDSLLPKFAERYTANEEGCWIWTGMSVWYGYGVLEFSHGNRVRAHRLSYILKHGPIPDGLCVCHKCDTPACVNPEHLFLGTHSDNMRDMTQKGRNGAHRMPERVMRGTGHPRSVLSDEDIKAIRSAYKRPAYNKSNSKELAAQYGINLATVNKIVANKCWRHI